MPPYSLNVPVPGTVAALAAELAPLLTNAESVRESLTLVLKRLGDRSVHDLESGLRVRLRGTPSFELRITGLDAFTDPAAGPGPVVYLAVDSPVLECLHEELCAHFEPAHGIEGPAYVPHVTLARGVDRATLDDLLAHPIDPIAWTATELVLWDGHYRTPVSRFRLPV